MGIEKEVLQDSEQIASYTHQSPEEGLFQSPLFELVDQLEDLSPYLRESTLVRKLIAPFGDAYFYFNQMGDLCFLTDFVKERR